jgi:hypothetical protein
MYGRPFEERVDLGSIDDFGSQASSGTDFQSQKSNGISIKAQGGYANAPLLLSSAWLPVSDFEKICYL